GPFNVRVHGWPLCVMVTEFWRGLPTFTPLVIVSRAVLDAASGFLSAATAMLPLPSPVTPSATLNTVLSTLASHLHPRSVDTLTLPVPPSAGMAAGRGPGSSAHGGPS